MNTPDDIRKKVGILIDSKGSNLREASLAIGRKDSYLHQYVNYGYPLRLKEHDRKMLATFLEVPEQELTDLDLYTITTPSTIEGINMETVSPRCLFSRLKNKKDIVSIEMLDVTACCGNNIENLAENVIGQWIIPMPDFHQITMSAPKNIKLIRVKGDSMAPTLKDGDWVMVDITHKAPDSDGLFLLLLANGLAVKRVQCGLGQNITVISDNPIYAPIPATLEEVPIAGKVIYTLKSEKVG